MKLRYNYRMYPTPDQVNSLARAFGCARVVYNDGLRARKDAYAAQLPYISDVQLSKLVITQAKQTPEREWLSEVSNVVLQQSLMDLHAAYRNFFNGLKGRRANGQKLGPPRFKRKSGRQSIRLMRNAFSLRPNRKLYLAKVGELKVTWSRELPSDPSSVSIVREPCGKYYASFVVEVDQPESLPELDFDDTETGIDLGLSSYAILRGRKIDSPKFFRRAEHKLKKAQRELSRKQKGSNNRRKARITVAKVHAKVRDQRNDFIGKQVARIIRENQAVYLETLSVKGMARLYGKSVSDQSLSSFVARLKFKAAWHGRYFWQAPRDFPSTQLCSACGSIEGPKGREMLSVRTWTCSCGVTHDRDENAEKNLRAAGRAERINACGARVRPAVVSAVGDEAGSRGKPRGSTSPRRRKAPSAARPIGIPRL